jgi:hypothetical protein
MLFALLAALAADFEVPLKGAWLDTKIDVAAGDTVKFELKSGAQEGSQKGWKDLLKTFPVNDAGRGAAVARIGSGRAFFIGAGREWRSPTAGRLYLGANLPEGESGEGSFQVTVARTAGKAPPKIDVSKLPKLTQEQLDGVPNRVSDLEGTPGDRVNFAIVGSEKRIVNALISAGWVKVDRNPQEAVIGALGSILARRGYVELPMSELYLFDRAQDYGFAMGDPVKVIAARHHFRIWKAPFTAGETEVWIGAGTHDIGFDKDQRNGNVTHKIDENTDGEREFIAESLRSTGEVAHTYYLTHRDPVKKAKTAHGQEFFSDGRTLVIVMRPDIAGR